MPKSRSIDWILDAPVQDVRERLASQTRRRAFAYQSSMFGGSRPLGGTVGKRKFKVAIDDRTFVRTMRPVARCTLAELPDGRTRVTGELGMPTEITWMFRAVVVLVPIALLIQVVALAPLVGWAITAFMVATVLFATVLAVGMPVANADAGIDALEERLRTALQVGSAAPTESESQRVPAQRPRQTEG